MNFHAVEDVLNVPYLSAIDPARRHATDTTSGRRIQYRYPELLPPMFAVVEMSRTGKIGNAICLAIKARHLLHRCGLPPKMIPLTSQV